MKDDVKEGADGGAGREWVSAKEAAALLGLTVRS
jgi:hypothetical protein